MLTYPHIDPVIFSLGPFQLFGHAIGPLAVRWYGLMYVVGFMAAIRLARRRAAQPGSTWKVLEVDDLIFYTAVGVILGGRIGWVLFYGTEQVLENPWRALRIWEGGMAFHGGLMGVVVAMVVYARTHGRKIADVFDFVAPLPAIGLMAGRIGNFINGELWGKPTDVPWAFMVDGQPRHPSQLYEATLEGLVLFIIIWTFTAKPRPQLAPAGLFSLCYGLFRFAIEFVRVPDENRGYLAFGWLTMGQILSTPMILVGVALLIWAYRARVPSGNYAARAT
jgi:phosphatidylglycerol:prolipoprotein diacylglycerol transferase